MENVLKELNRKAVFIEDGRLWLRIPAVEDIWQIARVDNLSLFNTPFVTTGPASEESLTGGNTHAANKQNAGSTSKQVRPVTDKISQGQASSPRLILEGYLDARHGHFYPRLVLEQSLEVFYERISAALFEELEDRFNEMDATPLRAQDVRACKNRTIRSDVPEMQEEFLKLCQSRVKLSPAVEQVRSHLEDYAGQYLRDNYGLAESLAKEIAENLDDEFWSEAGCIKGRAAEFEALRGTLDEQRILYAALCRKEDAPFKVYYKNNAVRSIEGYEELVIDQVERITGRKNKVVWKDGRLVRGKHSFTPCYDDPDKDLLIEKLEAEGVIADEG